MVSIRISIWVDFQEKVWSWVWKKWQLRIPYLFPGLGMGETPARRIFEGFADEGDRTLTPPSHHEVYCVF